MAPIISGPLAGSTLNALERGFPTLDGQTQPRSSPPEIPLDDAFVIVVSIGVVAGLTLFVLLQALQALKDALRVRAERKLLAATGCSIYGTMTLTPSYARNPYKHSDMDYSQLNLLQTSPSRRPLLANLQPFNYQSGDSSRTDSDATVTNGTNGKKPVLTLPHRCQFTLSPEEYDSDSSTSTTFTAARRDASFDKGRRRVPPGYFNLDLRRTPQIEEEDEEEDEEEESEHSTSSSSCFLSDSTAINPTSVNHLSLSKQDPSTKSGKGAVDYFSYKPKPNTVDLLTAANANNNPVGMKEKIGKICVVYDDTTEQGRDCAQKAKEEEERGWDDWKFTPRRHARRRDAVPKRNSRPFFSFASMAHHKTQTTSRLGLTRLEYTIKRAAFDILLPYAHSPRSYLHLQIHPCMMSARAGRFQGFALPLPTITDHPTIRTKLLPRFTCRFGTIMSIKAP
ncbi:hypothetical protein FRC15_008940 [Serendipita sp. 397]|nr:hypothetical protein FRC15_008940 [Serendipita sp. 397]